ncbi:MAG: hypothetical protein M3070_15480 [Actinomycetota bacterium]|nr:hypothetical protein [Actinomycetota bacterium]
MSIVETVLIFAGIPAGITAVLAAGVFGRSAMHQPNRYRPGRPWTYPPAWYVPHPDAVPDSDSARAAIEGSTKATAAVGGASGEW